MDFTFWRILHSNSFGAQVGFKKTSSVSENRKQSNGYGLVQDKVLNVDPFFIWLYSNKNWS